MPLDGRLERGVECPARGKLALINYLSGNARLRGEFQAGGVGTVADHCGDLRGEPRAHDRLHVAAAAGDQDDDVLHATILPLGFVDPIPTEVARGISLLLPYSRCGGLRESRQGLQAVRFEQLLQLCRSFL